MTKMFFSFYIFLICMFLILFTLMNTQLHPIIMILMILLNTISICWIMTLWQSNSLYSILLFLIMISGLLIIFLYFSSIITNTQNKFSFNYLLMINFIINLIFFFYFSLYNFIAYRPLHYYLETYTLSFINQNMFKNLYMIYYYPFNNFTILCMFFLLIAMFITIKMCTIKSSPLRKIS